MVLLVLCSVSPCPFALIKHLEHVRRQITASDTGVLAHLFYLLAGPWGALAVFHGADCDIGAVIGGAPQAQAVTRNRVALSL